MSVLVRRGEITESRHLVHIAAVRDGEVLESAGEPDLVTFLRSSAKPFQALPLVRAAPDLPDAELAVACASHAALEEQLGAVRALLARAYASEDELECGEHEGSRLRHNCSGKHAGMLLLARLGGWPPAAYHLPAHPVQREAAAVVAGAAGLRVDEVATAVDGCGVVTFALPLRRMAEMFSRLVRGELACSERVVSAMRARSDLLVGRAGSVDVAVMRSLPGSVAKGGAEGLLCVGLPDGTGVALKVEDGGWRAVGPAAGCFLGIDELREREIVNSRGERVGEIVAESR